MKLRSLEDLELYKDSITNYKINNIDEVSEVGGESNSVYNNRLFYWKFLSKDIKSLCRCFSENFESEKYDLNKFEREVNLISNSMINRDTCPIEAILYASKIINNLICTENIITKKISNIIYEIYMKKPLEYKETIEFILREWTFSNQIMIIINACSKIKDLDLLKVINDYHTKNDNKIYALKSFMSVKNEVCIEYTLSLISTIKEQDSMEVEMGKFFINNYINSFGDLGIIKLEEYLQKENINYQAKKVISRALPNVSKVEKTTLNTMIKKAKNWRYEEDFEECFNLWIDNFDTRKDAFLAIRYSNYPYVEEMLINAIDKYECNSIEIGTALITLAQWGSRIGISENFYNIIDRYKYDDDKKIYCYASMCSIGKEEETKQLIREYIEQRCYNHRKIFSIIRDCSYKSSKLLKKSVNIVYNEYLTSFDDEKIIKAINSSYEMCNQPKFNFRDIIIPKIKNLLGIYDNNKAKCSEHVYLAVLNLVDRLLDDKNKDEFIDILFFIIESKFCKKELKSKSTMILKRLKVDPPK